MCEVMAQQTQVARASPSGGGRSSTGSRRPRRWRTCRPPRPSAGGPGLGYNRRALALHRTAQAVVRDHGGRLPGRPRRAARAARASAPTPPGRCWPSPSRPTTGSSTPTRRGCWRAGRAGALGAKEVQAAADAAVPAGRAWAWNQAMLDLGATVCTRRAPRCDACPVADDCAWARAGHPDPDPADGSAGVSRRPVALRGQRPPGPGPPGRGAARRARSRSTTWPR